MAGFFSFKNFIENIRFIIENKILLTLYVTLVSSKSSYKSKWLKYTYALIMSHEMFNELIIVSIENDVL